MTCNLHKYGHIPPFLKSLRVLKVDERISNKIAMLVYKSKTGDAQANLIDMLPKNEHGRPL